MGLAHLKGAFLESPRSRRLASAKRAPLFHRHAFTPEGHVLLDWLFNHVAAYAGRAALNGTLTDVEPLLRERDDLFGPVPLAVPSVPVRGPAAASGVVAGVVPADA